MNQNISSMKKIALLGAVLMLFMISSCSNDDDGTAGASVTSNTLRISLTGLENLGSNFVYEGWLIVNGSPITTGRFTVDDSGNFSQTLFTVDPTQLQNATKFVLTIEPTNDPDPAPSNTKVLAGDFSGSSATVTSSIVGDFSTAQGKYILATPTDNDASNEASGVWFLDNSSGSAVTGLNLPTLPNGWKYEGWVVFNGVPLSTGTFSLISKEDDNATTSPYKGNAGNGPAYPGEDYLQNAPGNIGTTFPTDLRGRTLVISVEPFPDNSPNPFTLKPLAHVIPNGSATHTTLTMGNGPVGNLNGIVFR